MGRLGSLEILEGQFEQTQVRRIPARRTEIDRLRARLDLLDGADRTLLKMYLDGGGSFDELARLTGLSRSAVCRRIHRTIRRLRDETYALCRAKGRAFPESELAIVQDHFVRGLSVKSICRDRRVPYYRARMVIARARRLAKAARRTRDTPAHQRQS